MLGLEKLGEFFKHILSTDPDKGVLGSIAQKVKPPAGADSSLLTPGIAGDNPLEIAARSGIGEKAGQVATSTNMGEIPTQVPPMPVAQNPDLPQALYTRSTPWGFPDGAPAPKMTLQNPSGMAHPEIQSPHMDMDRSHAPIPQLPGRSGPPRPWDPRTEHEYDWMMDHLPLEHKEITRPDGSTFEGDTLREPTGGDRFKSGLKSAGISMLRSVATAPPGTSTRNMLGRAIGAGGAGGVAGAYSPAGEKQLEYDTFEEPKFEREYQRQNQYQREQRETQGGILDQQAKAANIGHTRAQTREIEESILNGKARDRYIPVRDGLWDSKDQYWVREPNDKPQLRNTVDPDGISRTYAVYSDGEKVLLGESERAKVAVDANTSREKIAADRNKTNVQTTQMRQEGANGRAASSQAGQDRRTGQRLAAKGGGAGKVATMAMVQQYATKNKMSLEAAKQKAISEGFTIK